MYVNVNVCVCMCMYVYVCVCICVCMCMYVYVFMYLCVNRIIPVPDVSFGLLFQSNAQLFPAFQVGMAEQRTLLSAWLGS